MTTMPKTLPHYRIKADRRTGDWLSEPEHLGDVYRDAHLAQQDTDTEHYDIHEQGDGCLPETLIAFAVTTVWKD